MKEIHYNFNKENIIKTLIPKSMFGYPRRERIIIKQNGFEDIIYRKTSEEVTSENEYNCWYVDESNGFKFNIYQLANWLLNENIFVKSIEEKVSCIKNQGKVCVEWLELYITLI